jgi:hypothetical protein
VFEVVYGTGNYTLTREKIGTRYAQDKILDKENSDRLRFRDRRRELDRALINCLKLESQSLLSDMGTESRLRIRQLLLSAHPGGWLL